MKTPAQGARTPIYLASSPDVEGITGRYFANGKPKASSKASYDTTTFARLWQVSAGLAGITATGFIKRLTGALCEPGRATGPVPYRW